MPSLAPGDDPCRGDRATISCPRVTASGLCSPTRSICAREGREAVDSMKHVSIFRLGTHSNLFGRGEEHLC
ncbi:unnamed protein product [Nyctereutes procyonoides]|uniref:(raccoon dog) hypothetical protein n=1 Tax=Nyctereutes procyonoides TaxID=34880 RepID=A0A811ZBY1_NYCPR|nr:unnamed protein product [Nyctereutes procyonoides]